MNSKLLAPWIGAAAVAAASGCANGPADREATARLNWSSVSPNPLRETVPASGTSASVNAGSSARSSAATTPSAKPSQATAPGTVLLVVRFANEVNPNFQPTNLALTLEDTVRRSGGQFVFKPFRAMPGQFAEFLVRLDLPAGDYRVTRLFGVAGQGQTAPQFDFPAEQRFTVEAARTAYLGRVEVTNRPRRHEGDTATGPAYGGDLAERAGFSSGSPRVTAHDAAEEDLVSFRTQWNDLRERRIETRLPESFGVPAPQGSASAGVNARFPQAGVPSGEFVTAQALDLNAAASLPAALRNEFAKFVASKRPRAFAFEPGGAFASISGGQQVIARALAQCEQRRAPNKPPGAAACVLFAVDDTVIADSAGAKPADTTLREAAAALGLDRAPMRR